MKWEAPTIAEFAREAGFVRPELHTATAIALAGSAGIDHYDLSAGAPGAGRWCGLWAVNVNEWPDYTSAELVEPRRAAAVAYELTRRCDGFGWSSHWRSGADRRYLAVAGTASSMAPFHEHEHVPVLANLYGEHVRQQRARLAG